ncbi:PREDICTED: WAP four-disulfide core domain protein 18-like [Branchiostoma belcheri]|uniref:WAP four-disulfide core domain protein 18-like n=1 Tax=Branchiostoma belcheri TaxID=7741 RepID=A0A6P4Y7J0_BRABE|nr:PREDICTED: WAP four-disulfide core domain protein 18-like [Branchiostoma belcheri]
MLFKLTAILVAFIALGPALFGKKNAGDTTSGQCPEVTPGQVGTCVEACSNDSSCTTGQLCCSNGCGHTCQDAVFADSQMSATTSPPDNVADKMTTSPLVTVTMVTTLLISMLYIP